MVLSLLAWCSTLVDGLSGFILIKLKCSEWRPLMTVGPVKKGQNYLVFFRWRGCTLPDGGLMWRQAARLGNNVSASAAMGLATIQESNYLGIG
jgi:hypothetical protein